MFTALAGADRRLAALLTDAGQRLGNEGPRRLAAVPGWGDVMLLVAVTA